MREKRYYKWVLALLCAGIAWSIVFHVAVHCIDFDHDIYSKAQDNMTVTSSKKPQVALLKNDHHWSQLSTDKGQHGLVSLFPERAKHGDVYSILLLPQLPLAKRQANVKHLIFDGVKHSPHLAFTDDLNNTDRSVIWVIDLLGARTEWKRSGGWCNVIYGLILKAQELRRKKKQPIHWPIAIVDNRDASIISTCVNIGAAVGDHNVRYSFRSATKKRSFSNDLAWVIPGTKLDDQDLPSESAYHYRHRPIGVRTDTVQVIESLASAQYGLKLCDAIENVNRPIDISYFWSFQNFTVEHANLRDVVYLILDNFRNKSQWNMVVGIRGNTHQEGRRGVSNDYVESLLHSKIVVVAQRDLWEDHYRLFEAMVAGALVFTDKMLSLPRGLKDGESVIEYNNSNDLLSKLDFYLRNRKERVRIAREGRFVAMSNHRSWQHMEEIVFGGPATVCSNSTGSACPFIVNASQINDTC